MQNKKHLLRGFVLALVLIAAQLLAAPAAYFSAVTNLEPAGYWPLDETTSPPQPFSESITPNNLGSLGTNITGYYGAWYQPSSNS